MSEGFIVNVEVAILRDDRYLFTVRGEGESFGAGWLGFPGGKLDWNGPESDAIEQTARREAMEEVGLTLDDPVVYVESHTFGDIDPPCLDVVVLARSPTGDPRITDPDEVAEIIWLSAEELRNDLRTQPWTIASLELVERTRQSLRW